MNQKKINSAKKEKKTKNEAVWYIVGAGMLVAAVSLIIMYFVMTQDGSATSGSTSAAGSRPSAEYPDTPYVEDENDPVVATVNGEPVTFDEMTMVMGSFRVETAAYFFSKYGLDFSHGFWETEIDGITPLDYIKERALGFLTERKVQQQFIREQGMMGDFSHRAFLRDFEAENARREETVSEGGIVYGVTQFDPMTYYDYQFLNNVQMMLTEKGDVLFPVSYADILRYYEENIANFREADHLVVDVIAVPLYVGDEDPYEKILRAEEALLEGRDFESVMREFNPDNEPFRVDFSGREAARIYDGLFSDMAWGLSEGEVSVIFEWGDAWLILKCAERTAGGYMGIEGREHTIMVECRWEKYDAFAEKLREEADVRIIDEEFAKLVME